jgi:hypothetical protein
MSVKNYNFCTLFDSGYLAKGLALYSSLERYCDSFHLYIFAFDKKCENYLQSHKLTNATIIGLKQFEDNELLKIKSGRSFGEYCWTCASSTILFCLEKYKIDSCTYLDADLFFFSSPNIIFEEIGDSSIAFTKHNYYHLYDQSATSGTYCVQFMYFRNDGNGVNALKWWRNKCIDWCYNYLEDGKFGDQGYLNELTAKFENVHIIKNQGAGMAPWNILNYKVCDQFANQYEIKKTNEKFTLVFFHFHFLKYRIESNHIYVNPGKVLFTQKILQKIYISYIKELFRLELEINRLTSLTSEVAVIHMENTLFLTKIMVITAVFLKRSKLIRHLFLEKRI